VGNFGSLTTSFRFALRLRKGSATHIYKGKHHWQATLDSLDGSITIKVVSLLWTFPLKMKFDTFLTLSHFFAYARTQFGASIKAV
jgi:hypothetical protein